MLAISRALSSSLESIPSPFLCGNRKMQPPPWVRLNIDFSLLVLLEGDVGLNPSPGVHGLRLGTVSACSMRDKAPALSDLVSRKGIDLLDITETWLTTRETSADLVKITPQGFSSFEEPRARPRGRGVGLFVSAVQKLQQSVCQSKHVFRLSCKLECGQSCLIVLNIYTHLVPLLLSSVS